MNKIKKRNEGPRPIKDILREMSTSNLSIDKVIQQSLASIEGNAEKGGNNGR